MFSKEFHETESNFEQLTLFDTDIVRNLGIYLYNLKLCELQERSLQYKTAKVLNYHSGCCFEW